mmetsp:Transcript_34709/g.25849  ORF Transcript_34709/g.25849 Transcript_34709/m.25849 type:complete len:128 (+) Transcript_34709:247-630(+)
MKILEKKHILKHDKVQSVHRERKILQQLKHPNVIRMEATFQDDENLYFVLEFAENGNLMKLLKNFRTLPAELARYYAAELVLALEKIHSNGFVHRDLKPENILIDSKYHIKISDFGDAKILSELEQQ